MQWNQLPRGQGNTEIQTKQGSSGGTMIPACRVQDALTMGTREAVLHTGG